MKSGTENLMRRAAEAAQVSSRVRSGTGTSTPDKRGPDPEAVEAMRKAAEVAVQHNPLRALDGRKG